MSGTHGQFRSIDNKWQNGEGKLGSCGFISFCPKHTDRSVKLRTYRKKMEHSPSAFLPFSSPAVWHLSYEVQDKHAGKQHSPSSSLWLGKVLWSAGRGNLSAAELGNRGTGMRPGKPVKEDWR